MEQIYTIYDRISKRCLSLSNQSTVNLINGLYGKAYPLDSDVTYNWTEHTADDLKRTLADTIITINQTDSFHMEIQMYPDGEIVFRVFEYGYRHSLTVSDKSSLLRFPEPMIIYLYEEGDAPNYQELIIDFGSQGQFTYRVPAFKYLNISMEELSRRKLIVLIPFQLLKLRKSIAKQRTPENLSALKKLICNDIIGAIETNEAAGNITFSEGRKLRRMTLQLYQHIYQKYEEMEEAGMNEIAEEALILDIDIIEYEHKKELEAKDREIEAQKREAELKAKNRQKEAETQNKTILALKMLLKGESASAILKATGLTQAELDQINKS